MLLVVPYNSTLIEVILMPWLSVVSVGHAIICMYSLFGSLVMWSRGTSNQKDWSSLTEISSEVHVTLILCIVFLTLSDIFIDFSPVGVMHLHSVMIHCNLHLPHL